MENTFATLEETAKKMAERLNKDAEELKDALSADKLMIEGVDVFVEDNKIIVRHRDRCYSPQIEYRFAEYRRYAVTIANTEQMKREEIHLIPLAI